MGVIWGRRRVGQPGQRLEVFVARQLKTLSTAFYVTAAASRIGTGMTQEAAPSLPLCRRVLPAWQEEAITAEVCFASGALLWPDSLTVLAESVLRGMQGFL